MSVITNIKRNNNDNSKIYHLVIALTVLQELGAVLYIVLLAPSYR